MKRLALLAAQLTAAVVLVLVAPVAAQAAATLGQDSFSRPAAGGWGTANVGGAWQLLQGPATSFRLSGGQGVVDTPSGYRHLRAAHLPGASGRDVDVTAKITLSAISGSGAYTYGALLLRRQATGAHLRVGLWAFADGRLLIHSQTNLGEEIAPDAATGTRFTGGTYHLRVQLQGANPTTVRARAWKAGATEPSTWQQTGKFSKGPQAAGTVGVRTSAVGVPWTAQIGLDDLQVAAIPVQTPVMSQWRQVFSDDFNGTALDGASWSVFDGPGHGGHGVRRARQVQVRDGRLVITAEMLNGVLHAGGIAHRRSYTYGRFEFRVRTDRDPSMATSGIVLTWPQNGGWPINGENDIYETGNDPDRTPFYSFVHFGATNEQVFTTHALDGSQWQDMAMEWDAKAIRMYRNGELVSTLADPAAIPDVAHRLGVQLDAVRSSMGAPVRLEVEYVRIYQRVA
jgi:hypothetical protein